MVDRGHQVKIFSLKDEKVTIIHEAVNRYNLLEKTTYFKDPPSRGLKKAWWYLHYTVSNFNALIHESEFSLAHPGTFRKAIRNLWLSQSIAAFLQTSAFDIVHAHFGQRGAIIANMLANGKAGGFKFVTSFHGHDLNPSFVERYKKRYKNLFKYADAVTVNSPYLGEILLKVCPHPKNLKLLQEGLRTDQYKKQPIESNTQNSHFTILFCGRLVAFKAPDLVIRIMDLLVNHRNQKHIRLRMVGDGKLKPEVERLIHKFGLKEHVSMLGELSQEQVISEMTNAQLFLLPGIHEKETGRAETQGLVIQEAQALELPVVVSDAGGAKYGLLDGVSGFVVKEGDIEGFADKIELLINNAEMRIAMGKAGRKFVIGTFDTRILGDKLSNIYETI